MIKEMSQNKKDMDERFIRVSVCDCNTGRFITSITKLEMEFIFETMVKASVASGDWINDTIKHNAVKVIGELTDYMNAQQATK